MKNAALPISLNQVLTRYWDLANLDTETTKGTITGQLKALDALREELAAAGEPDRPPRASNVYRAAWLRDADGAGAEETREH